MPSLLHTLAPGVFGDDTVPIKQVRHTHGVIQIPDRHSGMRHAHLVKVPGAVPHLSITMPFRPAYDALGLGVNVLDTFEVYAAKFEDYEVAAGSVHTKWSLSANAAVAAIIAGWSVDLDGDLNAEVECWPIGVPSGFTHPLTQSNNNALPTFESQPLLYTLGPMALNGSLKTGLMSHGVNRNINLIARRTDGSKFPTTAGRLSTDTRMTGEHGDPVTLMDTLTQMGLHISSNLVQYYYRYDAATGEVIATAGTGLSVTAAAGRLAPISLDLADDEVGRLGIEAICLSNDNDDPLVIGTSATVPSLN